MGSNSSSHEQVQEFLNDVTSSAFVSATTTCDSGTEVKQNMVMTCDPHKPNTGETRPAVLPEWYVENAACQQCLRLAGETSAKYFELQKLRVEAGRGGREFISEAEFMVGRFRPKLDVFTKLPIVNIVTKEVSRLQESTGLKQQFDQCAGACVACHFNNNIQEAITENEASCMDSDDVLNSMKASIENDMVQEMKKNTDVFASMVSALPVGADKETKVRQEIRNRVTSKLEKRHLSEMVANIKVDQMLEMKVGTSTAIIGQSQTTMVKRLSSSLRKQGVYNSVVTDVEIKAMQKAIVDTNTVEDIAGAIGNAIRKWAAFLISGMGLIVLFIMIGLFAAGLFLLYLARKGKGLVSKGVGVFAGNDPEAQGAYMAELAKAM